MYQIVSLFRISACAAGLSCALFLSASPASAGVPIPGVTCQDELTAAVRVKVRGSWVLRRYRAKARVFAPDLCGAPPPSTRPPLGLGCNSPLRVFIEYRNRNSYRANWLQGKVGDVWPGSCPNRTPSGGTTLNMANGTDLSCGWRLRVKLHKTSTGTAHRVVGTGNQLFPGLCGTPAAAATECSDGIDNDGDGLIDLEDGGCTSFDDDDEFSAPPPGGDDDDDDDSSSPPGGDDDDDDSSSPPPGDDDNSSPPPSGADFFVRKDGGRPSQCNGRSDRAYTGGNNNCAWSSPLYALNPTRMPEGSTLFIRGGTYTMGYGVPELPGCKTSSRWACVGNPIPKGVTIQGDCASRPKLVGVERARNVLHLSHSDNVTLRCLEITDGAECTEGHLGYRASSGKCRRDAPPFGPWSPTGIMAVDSANVKFDRINVHGMANRCVRAGALRNVTITGSRFVGCGKAGWDGDIPGRSDDGNTGTIKFVDTEISWNGCIEKLNGTDYVGCFGQQMGGYGDGLGTGPTAGNWVFERVKVTRNTSDGLDLLYLNREGMGGSFSVKDSWLADNAGSQLKTHAKGIVENNVIVGNCNFHQSYSTMEWGDLCRAGGNALSISGLGYRNEEVIVVNNTFAGNGDCLSVTPTSGTVRYIDNIFQGGPDWRVHFNGGTEAVCGHYCSPSKCPGINLQFNGNVFWKLKNDQCKGSGRICADPQLKNPNLDNFDPGLRPGSPAQGKGYQG